jgi:glycosyltransferase involved in cell wall biosynthesis
MKEPINILYDATTLVYISKKGMHRAGIFFASYNILKRLTDDARFTIILYVHDNIRAINYFKRDILLSRFPVCVNTEETPKFNITVHKNNIMAAANISKKIIYYLKILKNYLYLLVHRRNNDVLLKSIDIYISPLHPIPGEIKKHPHIKNFMILHDAIPVILHPSLITTEFLWFNMIAESLNKDTYYFCNSECTKRDFLRYYGNQLDENKMMVIHHAAAQIFYPDYDKAKLIALFDKYDRRYIHGNKYIFSLCSIEPRKNLIFTARCFIAFIKKHRIQDLYFCLGGASLGNFIKKLEKHITSFDAYREKIIPLGYVADEDVNTLYSNSLFFCYISQYEGFGVPPLEAMQAGTPVITSNNSSLPEVVGDAAITIDYDSEEQCVKAFEDLYFNEDLRKYHIEKGIERAKLFSWEKTADKMTAVIVKRYNG